MDVHTTRQTLHALYDLRRLAPLAAAAARLDPAGPPSWRRVAPAEAPPPRRLGVLAGSFNPPTSAHLALAEVALDAAELDEVAFTISKVTVDKEAVTRAALPDRLLVLSLILERLNAARPPGQGGYSAALVNRGLYADQAVAVRMALPALAELVFVVGYDKIVQVLDSRYYDDRAAALERLFANASFLVAPRAGQGATALTGLLQQPENRPYRPYVHALPLPDGYAEHSSSAVRAGTLPAARAEGYVPPEAAALMAEAQPYLEPDQPAAGARPDPYGVRLALLERLPARPPYPPPDEVLHLYQSALRE